MAWTGLPAKLLATITGHETKVGKTLVSLAAQNGLDREVKSVRAMVLLLG